MSIRRNLVVNRDCKQNSTGNEFQMIITAPTESLHLSPQWERPDLHGVRQLAQFPVVLIGDAQGAWASCTRPCAR